MLGTESDSAARAKLLPKSARRQDHRDPSRRADGEQRPDEEEAAGIADHESPRVDDDHARPDQPSEQHDDVSRNPIGKHQGSVQPQGKNGDRNRIKDRALGLADDVVRHVKGHEEKREQGRDGQHDVVLHRALRNEMGERQLLPMQELFEPRARCTGVYGLSLCAAVCRPRTMRDE